MITLTFVSFYAHPPTRATTESTSKNACYNPHPPPVRRQPRWERAEPRTERKNLPPKQPSHSLLLHGIDSVGLESEIFPLPGSESVSLESGRDDNGIARVLEVLDRESTAPDAMRWVRVRAKTGRQAAGSRKRMLALNVQGCHGNQCSAHPFDCVGSLLKGRQVGWLLQGSFHRHCVSSSNSSVS